MNICPVCRNVNSSDATVCRYCQTALTPPAPEPVPGVTITEVAAPKPVPWPIIAGAVVALFVIGFGAVSILTSITQAAAPAAKPLAVGTGTDANLVFVPNQVDAPPNTAVTLTFTNHAAVPHNLTFQAGVSAQTSPSVGPGTSETLAFTTPGPGTYKFVCTIHPGMEGRLVVK
jgi:plastocyanin